MWRRRHNFDRLKAGLSGTEDHYILPEPCPNSPPQLVWLLITCKEGTDRSKVVQYLEDHGVQTRMLFAGNLTKHPCFDGCARPARDTGSWEALKIRTGSWPTPSGWAYTRE